MNEKDYISQRIDGQLKWYEQKSTWNQSWYKRLKLIEILASVLIPFLSGLLNTKPMGLTITIGILGILIAFIEGLLYLYKFQENWLEYRNAAEFLKREKLFYLTRSGPYENNHSLQALVTRIESYTEQENQNWTNYVSQQKKEEEA
ncbi:MAG: DUF4231 domain-containing protein [Bacteroidota bacterium]